ncbi:SNF2 family N-terminal domain-containing protein [Lasiosphaeris hirsuta]|uniref:SNF2 family N-terminal domain-containing protein n=1 Tax=Lasiosphaeris hirsuta TaxID=260670 RepID=A0AA40A243_9PEZI|nr:SNF2 family N-terminal domain-containing protein [Lasiosphaeris hirsuta]
MDLSNMLNMDQSGHDGTQSQSYQDYTLATEAAAFFPYVPPPSQSQYEAQPNLSFDFNNNLSYSPLEFNDLNLGDAPAADMGYGALDELDDDLREWANHTLQELATNDVPPAEPALDTNRVERDSDDEMQVDTVESQDTPTAQDSEMGEVDKICYGMLYSKDAVLRNKNMVAVSQMLMELAGGVSEHIQKFSLTLSSTPNIVLSLPNETAFGFLRDDMTKALGHLLRANSEYELEAFSATTRLREQLTLATKPNEAIVQVSINIYGPPDQAEEIGNKLSDAKLWLQRPDYYKRQYEYINPQFIHFPDVDDQLRQEEVRKEVSVKSKPRAEEERIRKLVQEVHDRLGRAADLGSMEGDQRLKNPLLEHQRQGLSYMCQRESGMIPEKFRLWQKEMYHGQEMYVHRITRTRSPARPDEMGGGVLADEMGMGKTLSTLALAIETLEAGQEWAKQKQGEEHTNAKVKQYSHSTLVVVPSALLINSWLAEIQEHTGDALETIKYHGPLRQRNIDAIARADLVVTTYNTLATEYANKKSLLHKIHWYRLVLDEAHIIRRQSTIFYRTCADIEARSRWCLTGTPIQNRLEDVGALFAFLRADPFHSLSQFRRSICTPFEQGESVARDRLVLLYDSLCLQRTKDILKLPEPINNVRKLTLTAAEEQQYDMTKKILNRYMRTQVGFYPGAAHGFYDDAWKATKFGLFQAHLQLRILCNHGTFQKPFSWTKRDVAEERTAAVEAYVSEMGLQSELMCDGCKQPRPILESALGRNHHFVEQSCKHSLCSDCLDDCADINHCPLCTRFGDVDMAEGGGDDDGGPHDTSSSHHKHYFNQSGFSTKMQSLIKDLKVDLEKKKSIIFSCWTRTLHLIDKHLTDENISFTRVDGEVPVSKRQGIIDQFADDTQNVRVLLMTTGTGAFGLNLTAANRIFIIEPQWNPSVENQAIARAIRFKQKEQVQVTRYVIMGTVEEEMQTQQIKKRETAALVSGPKDGEHRLAEATQPEPIVMPGEGSVSETEGHIV